MLCNKRCFIKNSAKMSFHSTVVHPTLFVFCHHFSVGLKEETFKTLSCFRILLGGRVLCTHAHTCTHTHAHTHRLSHRLLSLCECTEMSRTAPSVSATWNWRCRGTSEGLALIVFVLFLATPASFKHRQVQGVTNINMQCSGIFLAF